MAQDLADHFRGCMLGLAVADALGSPFEGVDAYGICQAFGPARGIVDRPPVDALTYTDDAQMMIAVGDVLLRLGRVDEDALMAAFVDHYDPARGYGAGARQVIETAAAGGDWRELSRTCSVENFAPVAEAGVAMAVRLV